MAGARLAEAYVEISARLDPFQKGLNAAQARMRTFTGAVLAQTASLASGFSGMMTGLATGLAAAFGISPIAGAAVALGVGLHKAVKAGSDLNETLNKTQVIFGNAADVVISKSNEMASTNGVVKTEWMDAASEIGNLLQGMGNMGAAEAAKLSNTLTKAALDSTSTFNTQFPEAVSKIASALRGQSEPISEFGVDAQEAAVKQEALRMGLIKTSRELTTQEKVAARASLILNGLKQVEGDYERTSDGHANSERSLWGRIQNTMAAFGKAVMPIFEGLSHAFNRIAAGVSDFVDRSSPSLEAFSKQVVAIAEYVQWVAAQVIEAAQAMGQRLIDEVTQLDLYKAAVRAIGATWEWLKGVAQSVFEFIGVVWRNWSLIVGEATIRVRQAIMNAVEILQWYGDAVGQFLAWFGRNWKQVFNDVCNAVLTSFLNLEKNFIDFGKAVSDWISSGFTKSFKFSFTPILQGFEKTMEELPKIAAPHLTSLQDDIDGIREKMSQVETAHASAPKDVAKPAKKAAPAPATRKGGAAPGGFGDTHELKAEFVGLADFAKKIQTGAFEKDGLAKKTADATERTAKGVEKLAAQSEKAPPLAVAAP